MKIQYENFCSTCHSQYTRNDSDHICSQCGSEMRSFPFRYCSCGCRVYLDKKRNECWECGIIYDQSGEKIAIPFFSSDQTRGRIAVG